MKVCDRGELLLIKLEGHLILMMIPYLMFPEILEADLMMTSIGLKKLKDHPEDLNLKKMSLKKMIIQEGDLVGGMLQEPYPLLQLVEAGHLEGI